MKTSLEELNQIERYLTGKLTPGDRLLFEAKKITNPLLAISIRAQQLTYRLVTHHGRKMLRNKLEQLHREMMNDPANCDVKADILSNFKPNK